MNINRHTLLYICMSLSNRNIKVMIMKTLDFKLNKSSLLLIPYSKNITYISFEKTFNIIYRSSYSYKTFDFFFS